MRISSNRLLKNADLFSLTRSGGSIFQQIFSFLSGNTPIFQGNPRFSAFWTDFWRTTPIIVAF